MAGIRMVRVGEASSAGYGDGGDSAGRGLLHSGKANV
jgi:hypothetical protein